MNFRLSAAAAVAAFAALSAGAASADILAGVPANATTAGNWSNFAGGQNFLMQFSLGADSQVTGFDIYTSNGFGEVGTGVTIRIRNDVAGDPDTANLFEFTSTIDTSVVSDDQDNLVGAHFGAVSLAAGTYWMGMSGSDGELGWTSYDYGDASPSTQRQLSGETVESTPGVDTFGYEVEGTVGGAGVPEPAAWAMMLSGFFGAGAALRTRRRTAVAA